MNNDTDDLFADALERLLTEQCPPAAVRQIERGASPAALWSSIEDSGFLDALVPECAGGAGLSLAQALPLIEAEGRHALPLPLAHTMAVRAVLALEGASAPAGRITIATHTHYAADGSITCTATPCGVLTDWVAAEHPRGWSLLPAAAATRTHIGVHGSLLADLHWSAEPADARRSQQARRWRDIGAALAAAQLAGALAQVLSMTVDFANQREQFGRSIGKFQAIQHQLAVLAENVTASRMAAAIACSGAEHGIWPLPLRAALAKARCSEAAALAGHTAHAVHGAIGVTAEFDLQLFTRRLHEWRAAFGAESHWNRVLGEALLADGGADPGSIANSDTRRTTLDFMRGELLPSRPSDAANT
jgi:acyl-CoA dehydrogenase